MKRPPGNTMVCVTVQRTCERLIKEGAALSGACPLHVVHVVRPGGAVLGADHDGEALEYLFRVSQSHGADMEVLRADDVAGTLVRFAQEKVIRYLVMGQTRRTTRSQQMTARLKARLPDVEIYIIP